MDIEQVVAEQLQVYLGDTSVPDQFQSGFRPRYEADSVLAVVVDDLGLQMDKGNVSPLILLDLSAKFDTAHHNTLLD